MGKKSSSSGSGSAVRRRRGAAGTAHESHSSNSQDSNSRVGGVAEMRTASSSGANTPARPLFEDPTIASPIVPSLTAAAAVSAAALHRSTQSSFSSTKQSMATTSTVASFAASTSSTLVGDAKSRSQSPSADIDDDTAFKSSADSSSGGSSSVEIVQPRPRKLNRILSTEHFFADSLLQKQMNDDAWMAVVDRRNKLIFLIGIIVGCMAAFVALVAVAHPTVVITTSQQLGEFSNTVSSKLSSAFADVDLARLLPDDIRVDDFFDNVSNLIQRSAPFVAISDMLGLSNNDPQYFINAGDYGPALSLMSQTPNVRGRHPVVMIPGIVSTGLESWSPPTSSQCAQKYFRERLWGTLTMVRAVLLDKTCWVEHLLLDPNDGLDPPGIKLRAAEGLDAADYLIGPYWVWGKIIQNLGALGYDSQNMHLAAYDWRLAFRDAEVRDMYYSKLKVKIEMSKQSAINKAKRNKLRMAKKNKEKKNKKNSDVNDPRPTIDVDLDPTHTPQSKLKLNKTERINQNSGINDEDDLGLSVDTNGKVVIIAHSMGSLVWHHFMSWVSAPIEVGGGGAPESWVDDHIEAVVNIGGPMLGVVKAMSSLVSGEVRETVQPMASYILEQFFSRTEIAKLYRSWGGVWSMLPKGGSQVWGDEHGAPDDAGLDAPEMVGDTTSDVEYAREQQHQQRSSSDDTTFGLILRMRSSPSSVTAANTQQVEGPAVTPRDYAINSQFSPLHQHNRADAEKLSNLPVANMTLPQVLDTLYNIVEPRIVSRMRSHYGAGFTPPRSKTQESSQSAANTSEKVTSMKSPLAGYRRDPSSWANPLLAPLPHAPSMKMYCLYGVGKPTERGYYFHLPGASPAEKGKSRVVVAAAESGGDSHNGNGNSNSSDEAIDERYMVPPLKIDASLNDDTYGIENGVLLSDGDGTVPLLSLGAMCVEGWNHPVYNPAGVNVTTREYKHRPGESLISAATDPRGGPHTADHVDILGNFQLTEDILRIVSGQGGELKNEIHTNIREIGKRIPFDRDPVEP
ncbi:LACT-domain-containing protein [Ramicandelaber brevisporus]|nr:LACT-domain-containing protein [Ramicandelaber brevisporus]